MGIHYLQSSELMDIARRHCSGMGWPWAEPILIKEGLLSTSVHTNADHKGGNIYLRINARSVSEFSCKRTEAVALGSLS